MSHVQRLCPCCSGHEFDSRPQSFVACLCINLGVSDIKKSWEPLLYIIYPFFGRIIHERLEWESSVSGQYNSQRNTVCLTPGWIKPQLSAWLNSPSGACLRQYAFLWSEWPNPSKKNVTNILKPLSEIIIQLKEEKEWNVWHLGWYFIVASSAMPEDQQWVNYNFKKKKGRRRLLSGYFHKEWMDFCKQLRVPATYSKPLLDLLEFVKEGIRNRWSHHWGLPPVRASQ